VLCVSVLSVMVTPVDQSLNGKDYKSLSRSDFAWSGSPDPDQNGDLAIPLEHFVIY